MKAKYLSRAQAYAMCRDYQHLLGAPLDDSYNVNLILAAPYSRILQWQYVHEVLLKNGNTGAVSPDNPAGRYDVLLISMNAGYEQGFICKDLRSYLEERGLPFNASRYACLRSKGISMKVIDQILSS